MHLKDYLGMKLTDIMNDEKGSIILEFNNGPSLVFRNVVESNLVFKKDYAISEADKIKLKNDIAKSKSDLKKKKSTKKETGKVVKPKKRATKK